MFRGVCGEIDRERIMGSMFCACHPDGMNECGVGRDFVRCPISPAEANSKKLSIILFHAIYLTESNTLTVPF